MAREKDVSSGERDVLTNPRRPYPMSNTHPPSFMERVRALKGEHTLCFLDDGKTRALRAEPNAHGSIFTVTCRKCRASWTLTISEQDSVELDAYARQQKEREQQQPTQGEGDGPTTRD